MDDLLANPEDLSLSQTTSMLCGTVAVVDMVGYSTIAKMLEENINAASVTKLNSQIQTFITDSLAQLPDARGHRFIAKTGDGAIVFFKDAEDAHRFGSNVHTSAGQHSDQRSEGLAERWFRVGITTGVVSLTSSGPCEYAGIAIANAVRLESSAKPGEIVVDANTFAKLSGETQRLYGGQEIVRGKRDERFQVRRCRVTGATTTSGLARRITRRRALELVGAASIAAGTAIGFELPRMKQRFDPPAIALPAKRFVALMAWPAAAPENAAVVQSAMSSIYKRVRRAEQKVPNLVILGPSDISDGPTAEGEVRFDLKPNEVAAIWGATLILAIRVVSDSLSRDVLQIELSDEKGLQVFRHQQLELNSLSVHDSGQVASKLAAKMLDLPEQEERTTDEDELASVSAEAQRLVAEGRAFGERLNDTGLGQAITRYEEVTKSYPEFALGYAELGRALWRQFENTYELELAHRAEQKFTAALERNQNSFCAHMGQAALLAGKGDVEDALRSIAFVLQADPENTEALFLRGRIYEKAGAFDIALRSYRMLCEKRPYYWKAHNNLGFVQYQQGNSEDALASFGKAVNLGPLVAVPLANRGVTYHGMGNHKEAMEDLNRSVELSPNESALSGLGDIFYEAGDYSKACNYFKSANSLEPNNHLTWSDLADTYQRLKRQQDARRCMAKAADLLSIHLSFDLKDGPSWMMLGLYHARLNDKVTAEKDIQKAEALRATDAMSNFVKARALAAMNRTVEAASVLIGCLTDNHISLNDVDLALELDQVRLSPMYKAYLARIKR